jgi:Cu+-exporting ATPase
VVTDLVPLAIAAGDEALRLAAALEQGSEHPLARAILQRAQCGASPAQGGDFRAVPGKGVEGDRRTPAATRAPAWFADRLPQE